MAARRSSSGNGAGEARARRRRPLRCAIYTRKSSEEGLDQAFNSLDAQRAACEAYIDSQKHEGWAAIPAFYDDGGYSGGSMERPALQRLLEDIRNGAIDAVVVYKVDRLTRSLADFAKIIELFDARGVSFVSVTQSFNTTSSMGRLTLNVLLSFAQFEREVTGERIRDKIAASKKKGMWMGGLPPLGYDVRDRKLLVNEGEAETVREIFNRYSQRKSVHLLKAALDADGVVSKERKDRFGRATGGRPFSEGALYHLLQNPLYRGEIRHGDDVYPGEHAAIVDEALWSKAEATLAENRRNRRLRVDANDPSLLAGLVVDEMGDPLIPTHAAKKGTRYRYYVSRDLIRRRSADHGSSRRGGWRLPASDLETLVETKLIRFLSEPGSVFDALEPLALDSASKPAIAAAAASLSARWRSLASTERRAAIQMLVERITVSKAGVEVSIKPQALADNSGHPNDTPYMEKRRRRPDGDQSFATITLFIPAKLERAKSEMRLLVNGADHRPAPEPDQSLVRLIVMAHRFRAMLASAEDHSIVALASRAGVSPSYFTRVLRLSFLAPDIVREILGGSQSPRLTAKRLIRSDLALGWAEQRRTLS